MNNKSCVGCGVKEGKEKLHAVVCETEKGESVVMYVCGECLMYYK